MTARSSLEKFLAAAERLIAAVAIGGAWVTILILIAVQFFDIVARQFITTPSGLIRLFELRMFMALVVLSLGYAYLKNAHVRVDILRERFGPKGQAWIEVFGGLIVLLPLCATVIAFYLPFIWQAYIDGERTGLFLGLPLRWLVKSVLPFGFLLLGLSGTIVIVRNLKFLFGRADTPPLEPD